MKTRLRAAHIVLLSLAFLGGCYESSTPLGPAERGAVDPELLGTWTCRDATNDANVATLLVLAFDSSRYFLEWRDKDETTRWAAHSSIVGGALLHNVRELKPDGRDTKWAFLRALTPRESELLLSVVKDEKLKDLGEAEALREIRRRVNDESLYKPWATCRRGTATPAPTHSGRVPITVFRDCRDCPEMVVIPAGRFTMGSSASEKSWAASHGGNLESVADESPQHVVALKSFALGKYDVTRGEYAAFVRETGYPAGDGCGPDSFKWNKQPGVGWQNPGFSQSDRDPVVCVSWQDARAYVSWLNGKVLGPATASGGGPYRLPSESEWEYAARAGTTTWFWWGDDDGRAGDHAWYKGNSGGHTHPVGSKPSNAFGLHDMVGNVWQWTQDCYADNYADAPTDGSASETGNTCLRVDRGAAWLYPAWLLRSATRERNPADYRDVIMGFRLARTLP